MRQKMLLRSAVSDGW